MEAPRVVPVPTLTLGSAGDAVCMLEQICVSSRRIRGLPVKQVVWPAFATDIASRSQKQSVITREGHYTPAEFKPRPLGIGAAVAVVVAALVVAAALVAVLVAAAPAAAAVLAVAVASSHSYLYEDTSHVCCSYSDYSHS